MLLFLCLFLALASWLASECPLALASQGAGLIFFPVLHRAVEHSSSLFILGFAFHLVVQGLLYDVESLPLLRSPCLQQTREAHGMVSSTRIISVG